MAKAKKPNSTIPAAERAIRQRLREEYEVGRYRWLNGLDRPPMSAPVLSPSSAPVRKKKPAKRLASFQADRVRRLLPDLYPQGVDGVPSAAIQRKIAKTLKPECDRLGIKPPSPTTVKRVLGRRK